MRGFILTPLTLLTGVNGSGKSSVIEALMLLKNTSFKKVPYILDLDKGSSKPLSFDLLKNRDSSSGSFFLGYRFFNELLSEEICVIFSFAKAKDFSAQVNEVRVLTPDFKKQLIYLIFGADDVDHCVVDMQYFRNKLDQWKTITERYKKFEDLLLNDEELPGVGGIETVHIGLSTDDERELERKESLLKKEYNDICERGELNQNWRLSLKYYFFDSLNGELYAKSFSYKQFYNILENYRPDEVLNNYPLLTYLLKAPKNELNTVWLKAAIEEKFPEYASNLLKESADIFLSEVIDFLKMNDYPKLENELITDFDPTVSIKIGSPLADGELDHDRAGFLIQNYFSYYLGNHPFINAVEELSVKLSSTPPIKFRENPLNLSQLKQFTSIVYNSLIKGIQHELSSVNHLPLSIVNAERLLDIAHPLSRLISSNRKVLTNNPFTNKWLAEFGIGNRLLIETPVAGLGYSLVIEINGRKKQLSDEGSGIIHLINLLLHISAYWNEKKVKYDMLNKAPTIILEEPEANMHPAWQSKLVEMFADAHESMGLNFIIETHSEYMVRKLQNMVAKKAFDRDKIHILYFGENLLKDKMKHAGYKAIKIEPDGTLSSEFGPGFYDEADSLAFELMKLRHSQSN